jgi:hypothetical protein
MAKVNIYIPDELLEEIDASATSRGLSRSAFVQEAAAGYLTVERDEKLLRARRAGYDRAKAIMDEIKSLPDPYPDVSNLQILRALRDGIDLDELLPPHPKPGEEL